jgi:hypothetical protein
MLPLSSKYFVLPYSIYNLRIVIYKTMILLCCIVAGYAFDLFSHERQKRDCRYVRTFGLKTENLI